MASKEIETRDVQKVGDQTAAPHAAGENAASRELAAQIDAFKKEKSGGAKAADDKSSSADILPSGKKVERTEDGFPVGGRLRMDNNWQASKDADMWSGLQQRPDLDAHEKFAAGTMGLQLRRRVSDPLRDDLTMNGTSDQRVEAAQKTYDNWTNASKVLAGKLNPEEQKLATKVSDELKTELLQEQWRKQRFAPKE